MIIVDTRETRRRATEMLLARCGQVVTRQRLAVEFSIPPGSAELLRLVRHVHGQLEALLRPGAYRPRLKSPRRDNAPLSKPRGRKAPSTKARRESAPESRDPKAKAPRAE